MLTKQQALEFIHELSNRFSISMDLTKGIDSYLNVYSYSSGVFGVEGDFNSLEEAITEFIKRFVNTALLKDLKCLIPVDVDMLKVGQVYKVHIQEDWDHRYFTAKFLGFVVDNVLKFEDNKPCAKYDIKEIYKVNE